MEYHLYIKGHRVESAPTIKDLVRMALGRKGWKEIVDRFGLNVLTYDSSSRRWF